MQGAKIDFALVNAERLRREPQSAILNEHRHLHGLAKLGEVDCAELERIHTLVVDEMTRRGLEHSSPLECKAKAGLKLNEPHAYLVWKGKKKSIALPADDGKGLDGHLVGVPLVLCQNGAAGAEAYGEAILGNPAAMTPAQFDLPEYADCHCVRPEERREWWDGVKQFYVYPIKSFARYDKPRPVQLQEGCKCYLPDVRFKQYTPPTDKERAILAQSEKLPKQIILTPRAVSLTGSMLYGNHDPRDVDVVVVGAEWRPDEGQFVVPLTPTFKEKLERVLRAVYQTGNSVQYISEGEGPTFDHLPLYALALVRLPRLEVEHVSEMEPEMAEVGYDKDGAKYRPDQPRDEAGRFGGGGGGASHAERFQTAARSGKIDWSKWQEADKWESNLDKQSRDDFLEYTAGQYKDINGLIRHPELYADDPLKEKFQSRMERLTTQLDKTEIPEDVVVWRGAKIPEEALNPGTEFLDLGFVSTSLHENTGTHFAETAKTSPGTVKAKVEILVPKGSKGAYIRGLSHNPGEYELLLQRGTAFRVLDSTKEDGITKVRVIAQQAGVKGLKADEGELELDKFTWQPDTIKILKRGKKTLSASAIDRELRGATPTTRRQALQSYTDDAVVPGRPFVPLKPMRPAKEGQRQTIDKLYEMVDFEKHPVWYCSTKRDGIRVVVSKNGDHISILSDDGSELADSLPKTVEALRSLPYPKIVLDCECEAWRGNAHLPREAATAAVHTKQEDDLIFNIFDILFLEPLDSEKPKSD